MFVKVLILCSVVAVINCTHHDQGHSNSFRKQDKKGNYKFGYTITGKKGDINNREEKGDNHGNVVGSYELSDGKGSKRTVHYMADKTGFRAKIQTNEKGTTDQDAADAIYNGLDDKHNGHQNHDNYDIKHDYDMKHEHNYEVKHDHNDHHNDHHNDYHNDHHNDHNDDHNDRFEYE